MKWRSISPHLKHGRLTAYYAFEDVVAGRRSRQLPGRRPGSQNKSRQTVAVPVTISAPRVTELRVHPMVDFSKH